MQKFSSGSTNYVASLFGLGCHLETITDFFWVQLDGVQIYITVRHCV